MGDKSRLDTLLEKQAKLVSDIAAEKVVIEADKVLSGIGTDVATTVMEAAVKAGVEVKVLHGKFFSLAVDDNGKLTVEIVSKTTRKASTNGGSTSGNSTNGTNGQYEYFLANGKGPFSDIQTAMTELGIPEANRPQHNRYDRLSADWQKKIIRKAKVTDQPAAEQPAAEQPAAEQAAAEQPAAEQPASDQPAS